MRKQRQNTASAGKDNEKGEGMEALVLGAGSLTCSLFENVKMTSLYGFEYIRSKYTLARRCFCALGVFHFTNNT